jgi:tetratricopeptide (TPR) repeat protein
VDDDHVSLVTLRREVGSHPAGTDVPADWPVVPGYEIQEELGRGGMGVVYKARQVALDRVVALKVILHGHHAGARARNRLRREAEAIARLQHPGVVQIYEVGEHAGLPFLSLEFCGGGSLAQRIADRPQPSRQAAETVATLARAVQAAHDRGVVHRDLKPANVLFTDQGALKVTDFGLARRLDAHGPTQTGAILGTPSYMAPEQARGEKQVGPAADIWALGAVLYKLLTARPPFQGETPMDTILQVLDDEPVPVRRLQPKVPRDLETICHRCLRKNVARRYSRAADLADDLDRFLAGEPIVARRVGPVERAVKWTQRRPALAALVGACLVAVLAAAGAVPWHLARLDARLRERTREVETLKDREHEWRDRQRRAAVAVRCRQWLDEGQAVLEQGRPGHVDQAQALFVKARDQLGADARRDPDLAALDEAVGAHLSVTQRLRQLIALRDEAFFHLNRDVVAPSISTPQKSRAAAQQALGLFGVSVDSAEPPRAGPLGPRQTARLADALYEVLLILAEATAGRPVAGQPPNVQQRRQAREALRLLDRAARLRRPGGTLYHRRAQLLAWLGEREAARRERQAARRLPPKTALEWFLSGYDRWLARDAGATTDFEQALRLEPGVFWARFFLAVDYQQRGNLAAARQALRDCIRQRPDFAWLYVLRGHAHGQEGDTRLAEADFRAAVALRPDRLTRYVLAVNRGVLALQQGQTEQALTWLGEAVRLRPDLYHAHLNLAQAHQQRGELDRAAAHLDQAIQRAQQADLYRTRARLHLLRQEHWAALRDLGEAARLEAEAIRGRQPGNNAAALAADHVERGLLLCQAGRHEACLAACRQALGAQPDHAGAHRLCADALLQLGRYQEAVTALERCLAHGGRADADLFAKRALAHLEQGNARPALLDATRALSLLGGRKANRAAVAELYALRGWSHLAVDAPLLAAADFDDALRQAPSADAHVGRGLARALRGQHREAVEDVEEALRRGPRTSRLCCNAARVLVAVAEGVEADARLSPAARRLGDVYRQRAVRLLRDALALVPAGRRRAFWRDHVQSDRRLVRLSGDRDRAATLTAPPEGT